MNTPEEKKQDESVVRCWETGADFTPEKKMLAESVVRSCEIEA